MTDDHYLTDVRHRTNGTRTPPRGNTERVPPHDLDAEQAILGAVLLSRDALNTAIPTGLDTAHFYRPAHGNMWEAIGDLHIKGEPVDVVTVCGRLRDWGLLENMGGVAFVRELQAVTPAISRVETYSRRVVDCAELRALIRLGGAIAQVGYDQTDADLAYDQAGVAWNDARANARRASRTTNTPLLTDLTAKPWERPDWIWPGMLHRRDRFILGGPDKSGKSSVERQGVVLSGAGFHPFQSRGLGTGAVAAPLVDREGRRRQIVSLVVDLEGSEEDWEAECRPMTDWLFANNPHLHGTLPISLLACGTTGPYDPIASRADEADLFARLEEVRPDLLLFGPLYKLTQASEQWAVVAGKVQRLIDTIRARFNCAVIMETHLNADKRVAGSVDWGRWADLVVTMTEPKGQPMLRKLDKVADRKKRLYSWWPTSLEWNLQGGHLPFIASWPASHQPNDGGPPQGAPRRCRSRRNRTRSHRRRTPPTKNRSSA
jgi:hypothetical protein